MIHDSEFTAYAERFSLSSGLDPALLHKELRKPLTFLQNELSELAQVREPAMITIACEKGGDKPFFRVVWVDEDDDALGIELFVSRENIEMWVNGDSTPYQYESLRNFLPLLEPAQGRA